MEFQLKQNNNLIPSPLHLMHVSPPPLPSFIQFTSFNDDAAPLPLFNNYNQQQTPFNDNFDQNNISIPSFINDSLCNQENGIVPLKLNSEFLK